MEQLGVFFWIQDKLAFLHQVLLALKSANNTIALLKRTGLSCTHFFIPSLLYVDYQMIM